MSTSTSSLLDSEFRIHQVRQANQSNHGVDKQLAEDETLHLNVNMSAEHMPTIQVGSVSPLAAGPRASLKTRKRPVTVQQSVKPKLNVYHHSTHQKSAGMVLWLQFLIMVGLGVGFAYVVANYILN